MTKEQQAALAAGMPMEQVLAMAASQAPKDQTPPVEGAPTVEALTASLGEAQTVLATTQGELTTVKASLATAEDRVKALETELAASKGETQASDELRTEMIAQVKNLNIALGKTTPDMSAFSSAEVVAAFKTAKEGMANFRPGRQSVTTQTPPEAEKQAIAASAQNQRAAQFKL